MRIYCVAVLLAAPSSCVVTEWGEWDPCSATCGLGMRRRERMVKMPPIDGSMCKTEVAEVEKCMMPECREFSNIHFLSFPWYRSFITFTSLPYY